MFCCGGDLLAKAPGRPEFIENSSIRIGVDLDSGGGIFYFSQVSPERNLLNHRDKGRLIQQSYYGDSDGSVWGEQKWRWNPVQGGNYQDIPSKILAFERTPKSLSVKTRPKHWVTGADIDDAVMDENIVLQGPIAKLTFRFKYTGDKTFKPRHQELPAVFVDYSLSDLVFYKEKSPWTNGSLFKKNPGFPNEYYRTTERWAAYVNDQGWGIGIYFPASTEFTCYRYQGNLTVGPDGDACSYLAPIQTIGIFPGWTYEYDVYLTIGTLAQIRSRFADLRAKLPSGATGAR